MPEDYVERVWSHYQEAIYEEVAEGEGHLVVLAYAGSGKTSVIIESVNRVPRGKRVLLCAFNKRIQEELVARVQTSCDIKTLHGLGYGAVLRAWPVRPRPDDRANERAIYGEIWKDFKGITHAERADVTKLVRFAKSYLVSDAASLLALMDRFDCRPKRYTPANYVEWAQRALALARVPRAEIAFDDMVYLPAVEGYATGSYDVVFVDETQDLNQAQIACVKQALAAGGRIVALGDMRQAIYLWRGAGAEIMPRLIEELHAKVLPLSISYRCPKAVVRLAQEYVPDIEAADDAPEGEVRHVTEAQMVAGWRPGDFVLSRINAPLVRYCLLALQAGKRGRVQGRDIGSGLRGLIVKSEHPTVPTFLSWLAAWRLDESLRLQAAEKEDQAEQVHDRAECLIALSDGLKTTRELLARVDGLFADEGAGSIVFSSVHKAKGLEADVVWLLENTFRPQGGLEEENLLYVAVTRAKKVLNLVKMEKRR